MRRLIRYAAPLPWLLSGFGLMIALLAWRNGIVDTYGDSRRYLNLAAALPGSLDGHSGLFWYSGYGWLVKLLGWPKGNLALYVFQSLLATGALWALVRAAEQHIGRAAAWLAGGLYLLALDLHVFHLHLLTESVAASLSLLSLLAVAQALQSRKLAWWLPLLLLFTLVVRPLNITVAAAVGVVLVWQLRQPLLRWLGSLSLVLVGLLGVNHMLGMHDWQGIYRSGEIILYYADWKLAVPPSFAATNSAAPPLLQLAQLGWQEPGFVLQLFCAKAAAFLVGVRPYYSLVHNLVLGSYLLVLYVLAGIGWRQMPPAHRQLTGMYLLANVVIAGLTWADWENRFLLPCLPVLCWMAAYSPIVSKSKLRSYATVAA